MSTRSEYFSACVERSVVFACWHDNLLIKNVYRLPPDNRELQQVHEEVTLCYPGSQVVCGQLAARKEAASIPNWSVATDAEKVGRSCEDAFAHLLAGWTDRNMTAYLARG